MYGDYSQASAMEYQAQPAYRVRRRRARRPFRFRPGMILPALLGSGLGALAFALIGAVLLITATVAVQGSDRIVPGVTAAGVPLGGLLPDEAALAIEDAWQAGAASVQLSDGERTWDVPPAALGLAVDAQATAARARAVGRSQGLVDEMAQLYVAAVRGWAVTPVVTLDEEIARAGLQTLSDTVSIPPQDAALRFEGGQVIAVPGVPGRALDIDATIAALSTDPSALLSAGTLPVILAPVAPRIPDASAAAAEAAGLLAAPLTVVAYDPISDEQIEWTADPQEIAGWLAVESDGEALHVVVDAQKAAGFLSARSAELGGGRSIDIESSAGVLLDALRSRTSAALTVINPPTTYTVLPGDTLLSVAWKLGMPFWRIIEANPGINPNALTVGETLTIPSKNDLLPLPVVPGKRLVVSISDQRLRVYENRQMVQEFVISTGIDRSPTQPGVFQVQTHELNAYASAWDLWMPHFLGIYEAWPGFMNGFHGLPSRNGGQVLWANSLGRPTSYGCIILDFPDAEWLYEWAEDGVVVEITG